MTTIWFEPLDAECGFGVRMHGLTLALCNDPVVRAEIAAQFECAGMIVFAGVEQDDALQVAISEIFGPLKDHPVASVKRLDGDRLPGVIEIDSPAGSGGVVSVGGQQLSHWLPWHFDHCYNDELNRAGVLRAKTIVPEGGITRFVDGIALYNALAEPLRSKLEAAHIVYVLDVQYDDMRFGRPSDLEIIRQKPTPPGFAESARAMPRAIHPAVWTRLDDEKVLHISPWMAVGIEGREDAQGNILLEEACQAINMLAAKQCYQHVWRGNEMIIWDNWRMLHSVSGHDPALSRTMIRTTIKGDYGIGRFEGTQAGGKILSETMV